MYLFTTIALLVSSISWASSVPECMSDQQQPMPIDNVQVLNWKDTAKNQFLARAHVSGAIEKIYPDASGHHHFEIQLGNSSQDTLEVIYNEGFGPLPALHAGMVVEACGDFIQSTAQAGPYPPSPDGAIIHWVHSSNNVKKHPSGFLVINGQVCGQGHGN